MDRSIEPATIAPTEPAMAAPVALAEPVLVARAVAAKKAARPVAPRPKVLPIQIRFILDLPSLVEFKKILTIPTVGTELDQAEGMPFICRHDVDGVLLADNKTVPFAMKCLTVWQLRIFATKFQVPQSLVMKRDQAFLSLMVAFKQDPSRLKTSITKRAAAIQLTLDAQSIGTNRLISTLFGSTFKVLYAQLNNDNDHTGYEVTFGANNKIFWNNVVDSVNIEVDEADEDDSDAEDDDADDEPDDEATGDADPISATALKFSSLLPFSSLIVSTVQCK
jgi:hypothetical protein